MFTAEPDLGPGHALPLAVGKKVLLLLSFEGMVLFYLFINTSNVVYGGPSTNSREKKQES